MNLFYVHFITYSLLFNCIALSSVSQIRVNGFINEVGSNECIPYAHIFNDSLFIGTVSNSYGYYSIKISEKGKYKFRISAIGYEGVVKEIEIIKDTVLNVELELSSIQMAELTLYAKDSSDFQVFGMSNVNWEMVKNTPPILGEKDIIKTIQMLPGVQRGTEGSTALYVRGGGLDQNLIILDEAQLYNTNHLFGFLSIFNGDAIKSIHFWKSGIPAQYGGRVSSVIDIQMKEGNKNEIKGEGGIGLLSSRLTIEGPIMKNKSSFLISGRRSYFDLLTKPFISNSNKTSYSFYDLYAKLNFNLNQKNKIYLSSYSGRDILNNNEKETIFTSSTTNSSSEVGWGNLTGSFRWNHLFNDRIFSNLTLLYSKFNFNLYDELRKNGVQTYFEKSTYESSIRDFSVKNDFEYFINQNHQLNFGYIYTYHLYIPKLFRQIENTKPETNHFEKYVNHEIGLYCEDIWRPSRMSEIRLGLRYNSLLTPYKVFRFFEPRINTSYELFKNFIIGASYMRANQFIHLLSNTGIGLSTDLWVPATIKAPPTQTDQVSASLTKKFSKKGVSISIETYRKYLKNILTYKSGASFLIISEAPSNISWENNVISGNGLSYGTECLIQKPDGKLKGWIAYTLSWTVHNFDSLNNGKNFYAKYDSRHILSSNISLKISTKITLSINWVYSSGNALTVPKGYYYISTSDFNQENFYINTIPFFGAKNSFRAEAYHRLDFAIQFYRKKKNYERFWELGVFNAYNRRNPFYYYLKVDDIPGQGIQKVSLEKKSLFPILPSISYNIKF